MKKTLFLLVGVLLLPVVNIFAQDTLNTAGLKQLEKKIDNLTELINQSQSKVSKEELDDAHQQINDLEKENKSLKKFQKFKNERKTLMDSLDYQQKRIEKIESDLKNKDREITTLQNEKSLKYKEGIEKGKSNFIENYITDIRDKELDELLVIYNLSSVRKDIQLLTDKPEIIEKLKDVEKYYKGFELLSQQYNETKVNSSLEDLSTIKSSSLINQLNTDLKYYKENNDKLKSIIRHFVDNNPRVENFNDEIQQKKRGDILRKLASYLYNYDINTQNYPYLYDIIGEVIMIKEKDLDADLSSILKKM